MSLLAAASMALVVSSRSPQGVEGGGPPIFSILDLGPVRFLSPEATVSLNASGQVALTTPRGAVLWNDGVSTELVGMAVACDLNERLEVVGSGSDTPFLRAAVWRAGVVSAVGPTVQRESLAMAINAQGAIVGTYRVDDGGSTDRSFLHRGSAWIDPGSLGGTDFLVKDVNGPLQLVGAGKNRFETAHAFLWKRGLPVDLDAFPDSAFTESYFQAINDDSIAVGAARQSSAPWTGFLWKNGLRVPLPVPAGFDALEPQDINLRRSIVGRLTQRQVERACLTEGTNTYDLNTLLEPGTTGWELLNAVSINDRGEIAGYGFHGGAFVGFLLRPATSAKRFATR